MSFEKRNHLVAVQYGSGETVLNVIKVINVNDQTYKALLNKKFLYDQQVIEEKNALKETIETLKQQVAELQEQVKLLKGEE